MAVFLYSMASIDRCGLSCSSFDELVEIGDAVTNQAAYLDVGRAIALKAPALQSAGCDWLLVATEVSAMKAALLIDNWRERQMGTPGMFEFRLQHP